MLKCPEITDNEFIKIVKGRWVGNNNGVFESIPFTFNHRSISIESSLFSELSWTTKTKDLSESAKHIIRTLLLKWETICGNKIKFKELSAINPLQPGLVIAACSNLETGSRNGVTYYNRMRNYNMYKVVVCLPQEYNNSYTSEQYYLYSAAHELGHAVGLGHTHEAAILLAHLVQTLQGLSCSVMAYLSKLLSTTTFCTDFDNCGKLGFAIAPGPLDGEICQKIYSEKYDDLISSKISPFLYLNYMALWGGLMTSLELIIQGFFKELKFRNRAIPQVYVDALSELMFALTLYYYQFPVEITTPVVASVTAKFFFQSQGPDVLSSIKLASTLLSCLLLAYTFYQAFGNGGFYDISMALLLSIILKFSTPNMKYLNASFIGKGLAKITNGFGEFADSHLEKIQRHFSSSSKGVGFFQQLANEHPLKETKLTKEQILSPLKKVSNQFK
jgi:hypothetical protein